MRVTETFLQHRERGISLIELLVSLVIASILIVGAVAVYQQSRAAHRINDSIALLQEKARFALDLIEPDLRLASYWGLTNHAEVIGGRTGQTDQLGVLISDCNTRWYNDLDNTTAGINGTNVIAGINGSNAPMSACVPTSNYVAGTDILVLRRASTDPVAPAADRVSVHTNRMAGQLFVGSTIPAGLGVPPAAQTFALVVHGYHVSPDSTRYGSGVPSLRRQTLVAGPAIEDQEALSGVEDLQFQFGIDTDGDLDANRYVNADNPLLVPGDPAFDPDLQIVSVRIWLRLRSLYPEQGHTDNTAYVYADQNVAAPGDNFRRLVVSKTIQLRNTRERA